MARISGTESGLTPTWTPKKERKPRPPSPDKKPCEICGGLMSKKTVGSAESCRFCMLFFGETDFMDRGVTSLSADDAKERLDKIREAQWVMVLKRGVFSMPNGESVEIEPGDMFKAARVGLETVEGDCSRERTKQMFSVDVSIGPHVLTLWPHEAAQISFIQIMQMKGAGELTECFLSPDDEQGHFVPTQVIRDQIYAVFGHLVNEPCDNTYANLETQDECRPEDQPRQNAVDEAGRKEESSQSPNRPADGRDEKQHRRHVGSPGHPGRRRGKRNRTGG
jgi:hypothetical protein